MHFPPGWSSNVKPAQVWQGVQLKNGIFRHLRHDQGGSKIAWKAMFFARHGDHDGVHVIDYFVLIHMQGEESFSGEEGSFVTHPK